MNLCLKMLMLVADLMFNGTELKIFAPYIFIQNALTLALHRKEEYPHYAEVNVHV